MRPKRQQKQRDITKPIFSKYHFGRNLENYSSKLLCFHKETSSSAEAIGVILSLLHCAPQKTIRVKCYIWCTLGEIVKIFHLYILWIYYECGLSFWSLRFNKVDRFGFVFDSYQLDFLLFFLFIFSKCHNFFYPELYDFCWKLLMWHRVDFIVPESPRKPIFKKQFLITHFRTNVFRSICLVVKVENFISLFKGSGTKMDTEEVQICTFTTRKKCWFWRVLKSGSWTSLLAHFLDTEPKSWNIQGIIPLELLDGRLGFVAPSFVTSCLEIAVRTFLRVLKIPSLVKWMC